MAELSDSDSDADFRGSDGEQATRTVASDFASPARRIGPYRILESLGQGGMGEVLLAEQEQPVRRKVALKLIKWGMDTKAVIARFESERQALAMMDHPNIAKVYDAGATLEGRPYFAMEYVKGVPITAYCDRQRLTTEQRLRLFTRVCEGVQHAHQKGIIHRDLKPSNVLVSVPGARAVPKIIDFGVSKATEHRLTEKTVYTELGALIGTPEYMSPEQAELTSLDIDTRTDVYSLGVLLYQLLAGALPFESRELRQAGFDEFRRKIREDDPLKPSTRLGTLAGERSVQAAKSRKTDLSSLRRQLQGDLDWITMKALEKDRTRRYGSPNELAADVERHLKHEPVLAGPPSARYRAKKFVRRHRAGVGFAALLLLVLVGFAGTMTVQAERIARERDRANAEAERASREADRANQEAETANRVSEFIVRLFEIPDPGEARGNTITAREILDRGAEQIEKGLEEEPLIRARLLGTMGKTYEGLGMTRLSVELQEQALRIRERYLPPEDPSIVETQYLLARALYWVSDFQRAEQLIDKYLTFHREHSPSDSLELAWAWTIRAWISARLGQWDQAETEAREAEKICRLYLDTDDWRAGSAYDLLGVIAMRKGAAKEALEYSRRGLKVWERAQANGAYTPPQQGPLVLAATIAARAGDFSAAKELFERAVAHHSRVIGHSHPKYATIEHNYAMLLDELGEIDEALRRMRRALEIRRDIFGPEYAQVAFTEQALAFLLVRAEGVAAARPVWQHAMEIWPDVRADTRHDVVGTQHKLASRVGEAGDHEDALELFDFAVDLIEQFRAPPHQAVAILEDYARELRRAGRDAEAAEHEARAAAIRARFEASEAGS